MPIAPRLAFVDLETTGTSPARCRITEVGVVSVARVDDDWQVDEWSTLVDPGEPIPPAIRFLTGITDEMVAGAPRFADIAEGLRERLQGAVFVAHQARFDYGFLRAEFDRIGLAFGARTLCTVRLSRWMDPDRAPHTLDAIIARYGLDVPDRHRALGDARALWRFLQALSRRHGEPALREAASRLLQHPGLPAHLDPAVLERVPQAPGVYAMLGENDQPLYIGRSRHLRRRLASHFSAEPGRERAARLAGETHRLEWRVTAGELGARLLEGEWIRTRQPSHNVAQRRTQPAFIDLHAHPHRPRVVPAAAVPPDRHAGLYGPYASRAGARAVLAQIADRAGCCLAVLGLERRPAGQPCFRRQLGRCEGACVGALEPTFEAARLAAALAEHAMPAWPFPAAIALVEANPDDGTEDWHLFRHWRHLGTAGSAAQARALAAARPSQGLPDLEPEIVRLLRTELARPPDPEGPVRIVRLDPA